MSSETIQTITRDEAIARIRAALRKRSGKAWSVIGGKGTAWGWIRISAPPARCTWRSRLKEGMPNVSENWEEYDAGEPGCEMGPVDRAELASLLGLDHVHSQGENVAASTGHRIEYVDRAEGREPSEIGEQYWD